MNLQRLMTKFIVLIAALAALFALVPAQAADPSKGDNRLEGVIVSRDGNNLVVRGKSGRITNVTVSTATKIYELQGPLGIGILPSTMSADVLVPGLRIIIEPESAGQTVVAKAIQFNGTDMDTANAIQAALVVPQQRIQALMQELAAQKQVNAAQDQAIAALRAADAAISKRIGDLADYDPKAEINVLFDVNSAALSDKAKADLKDIAAKAKAFRGYLIQVAGYADAVGSSSRNQALSDRRAEAVVHYLQQECDVALSRVLTPIAMGASNPVAPNETAQGRAENRRATVKIGVNRGIGE